MCGSKGSAPTPGAGSTTTTGSSSGTSQTGFAQGPIPATGARYEAFLNKVGTLANTPFDPAMQSNVAPLNTFQNQSLNQMFNLGMDLGNFHPEQVEAIMSPFIQNVVDTTQAQYNNANKIQGSNLISQGIRSGNAFGGDRAGIAAAELAGQQQVAQAPVIAGLYQSGYTQALDEYNKLKQFGIQGAEEAMKAGTVQQAQSQRELDVATANAQQRGAYPFQVANWEGAALGGIGPLTGTVGSAETVTQASTAGTVNPPSANPLTQALGLGSSLVGLLSSAPAGAAGAPAAGGAVGAAPTTQDAGTTIGGFTGFAKDGGVVEPNGIRRFAKGGYLDDDSSMFGSNLSGDEQKEEERPPQQQAETKKAEEEEPEDEILRNIKKVGEQELPQAKIFNPAGEFKIPNWGRKQYAQTPNLGGRPNTNMGGIPTSTPAQQQSSGGGGTSFGKLGGSILGTAVGGPLGGMIGGGIGSLLGFQHGGSVDEGDVGDTLDTRDKGDKLDQGDPAVAPRTGNPDDEQLFRERMSLPPSRDTFGLDRLPARPSIPTPDPLAPYLGTEGPRAVTGPPRGSPAGGLPQQARDVSPLALTRERLQRELQDNPRLARTFDANTTAEIGRDPAKRAWYQALTLDRAVQTGQPLNRIVNAPDYYPSQTTRQTATTGQGVDAALFAGANPANYATGNASFDPRTGRHVGFAGGPQTSSIGGGRNPERGGIEGQAGLPYARAVGYTGPSRTAIGPAGPGGSQGMLLAGGDNTSGDLEISAQSRQPPGSERQVPPGQRPPGYIAQGVPGMATPPRDFAQRWATNPFTAAGIAMLRSQSPHLATGIGEGLSGAAGAIEHGRSEQVLDGKPRMLTTGDTIMWVYPDGKIWDSGVPTSAGLRAKERKTETLKAQHIGEDEFGRKVYGVPDPTNPGRYTDPFTGQPVKPPYQVGEGPGGSPLPEVKVPEGTNPELQPTSIISDRVRPEVLQRLSPGDAAMVKRIAEGKQPLPSGLALSKPYWQRVMQLVNDYDPSFDAITYNARSNALKDITSGVTSRQIKSLNTVMQHLEQFNTAGIALDNWKTSELGVATSSANAVNNWIKEKRGDPRLTDFTIAADAVSNELEKAFKGNNPAVTGIKAWREQLSPNMSPEQINAATSSLLKLLNGQIDSVAGQFNTAFGTSKQLPDFLSPGARATFNKYINVGREPVATPPKVTPPPAATPATPAPATAAPAAPAIPDSQRAAAESWLAANPNHSDAPRIKRLLGIQ